MLGRDGTAPLTGTSLHPTGIVTVQNVATGDPQPVLGAIALPVHQVLVAVTPALTFRIFWRVLCWHTILNCCL